MIDLRSNTHGCELIIQTFVLYIKKLKYKNDNEIIDTFVL